MKKKLIFVTTALWMGGIEVALVNLLNRLDPKRYALTVLILENRRELASRLPPHVRLLCVDREAYPFTWLRHLTEAAEKPSLRHRLLLWAMPAARWAEGWLFACHVRRTLAETFDTAVIFSDAAAGTGIRAIRAGKFLLVCHHGMPRRMPGDGTAWRKCEKIVAVSGELEDIVKKFRPRYAKKIISIPNVPDGEGILRRSREFDPGFAPGRLHMVTVGRLHRDKGMDLAVEAAAILRDRGLAFDWHIIGGGPEEGPLREKIEHFQLKNHVFLTGMRENPYPFLAHADLYVQPSRVEGYGLAIAEARLLGIPVIATDTAGARMQLDPDALCPPDPLALAARIQNWISDPMPPESWDWQAENREILTKWGEIL